MAWNNNTYLIGERVKIENEKEIGVVTRIDFENGLIYVLFKKLREVTYNYPQVIENNTLKPLIKKKFENQY
ncbi:MAG: putative secreted protein [Candidatus Phytoplasma cynodontis]|nr:MAG: putative secreted protein [Candidatus Phytoplasma cynodontis]